MDFIQRVRGGLDRASREDLEREWSDEVVDELMTMTAADRVRSGRMLSEASKKPGRKWRYVFGERADRVNRDDYLLRLAGFVTAVVPERMRDGSVGYTLIAQRQAVGAEERILRLGLRLPRTLRGVIATTGVPEPDVLADWLQEYADGSLAASIFPTDPGRSNEFLALLIEHQMLADTQLSEVVRRGLVRATRITHEINILEVGGFRVRMGQTAPATWCLFWIAAERGVIQVFGPSESSARAAATELTARPETAPMTIDPTLEWLDSRQ